MRVAAAVLLSVSWTTALVHGRSCPDASLTSLSISEVQGLLVRWNLFKAVGAEFLEQEVDGFKLSVLASAADSLDAGAYPRAQPFDWIALRGHLEECKHPPPRAQNVAASKAAPSETTRRAARRQLAADDFSGLSIRKDNGGIRLGADGDVTVRRTEDSTLSVFARLLVDDDVGVAGDLTVDGEVFLSTGDEVGALIEQLFGLVQDLQDENELQATDILALETFQAAAATDIKDLETFQAAAEDDIAALQDLTVELVECCADTSEDIVTLFDAVAVLDAEANPYEDHHVYVSDFLSDVFDEWVFTGADAQTFKCGTYNAIGGNLGVGDSIKTTLSNLPAHSSLYVTFTFISIDTWEGETAKCTLGGTSVWSTAYTLGTTGTNVCGLSNYDRVTTVTSSTVSHFLQSADLVFSTTINQEYVQACTLACFELLRMPIALLPPLHGATTPFFTRAALSSTIS